MPRVEAHQRLTDMLRIRRFEEQCIKLAADKQFPGHYHVYIGQEATAVSACAELSADDFIFTTWRNHGHLLARGAAMDRMLAEILGRSGGYAGGKSGTLHLCVRELGVPATSALVGGSIPLAVGTALACKRRGSGITVAFFGDAALEEGAFYEAMLTAAVWRVPILFVCENNSIPPELRKRGQFTSSTLPAARLADVPQSLQIPAVTVDGSDAQALADCFGSLVKEVRDRGEPRFVEVRCTRWPGSFPLWPELPCGDWQVAWAFDAKPDCADLAAWIAQSDPIALYIRALAAGGALDPGRIDAIDADIKAEVAAAARFALDSPYPAPAEAYRHVWA
ncbi:MAG: thiamine pyrophosphate-dependent dehydrogenase E1 component subunit alpha [Hyphomicrobiales bacterium]|nr:thiamine pyrophosphate-dependent dehydrogenase E1 component subunit alpha [Hyphomicrobiales bacterium]